MSWNMAGAWERFAEEVGAAAESGQCPPHVAAKIVSRLRGATAYGQSGIKLEESYPDKARTYPLGFNQAAVGAGLTVTVTQTPQIPFRPERLVVDATTGANFRIVSVLVGNSPQFAAAGEFHSLNLAPNAVGVRMACDVCPVGGTIGIQVRNTNAGAQDFTAVFFGTAAT